MIQTIPPPTIREVATEAGVSTASVSRALNGDTHVTSATRSRVHAAAARLGYSVNAAARALSTRRTLTIALLHPNVGGEFLAQLVGGIGRAGRRHGYDLLVSNSHDSRASLGETACELRGRVDGVIVWEPDAGVLRLAPAGLATVVLTGQIDGGSNSLVQTLAVDNHGGALRIMQHLLRLGHRRVATIAGPIASHDAAERLRAFANALRVSGLRSPARLIVRGDFSELSGYESTHRLLAARPRPTAIVAANDSMAIGALRALAEAGLSVPGDLAVVGFDDMPAVRFTIRPSPRSARTSLAWASEPCCGWWT